VVLLNGWETGFTNACPVASGSATTFGNLQQYLLTDGAPAVYLFDNCAVDANQPIETLGNDLGKFLNSLTDADGQPVQQVDLVAFSMGGLIARAYLAGLQTNGALTPPANPLVRDLVLIATPNFGSYMAANYVTNIITGTQSAEMIPGSAFLWNLATWNQRVDDLRGVNAIAIAGNAGTFVSYLTGASLANAGDGIVALTSASLGFVAQQTSVTRIVPYCHIDPGTFTNPNLGPLNCSGAGIANVTDESQLTGKIVRSFLAGTTDWQSLGSTPNVDPYLSIDGGTFFGMVNRTGGYVTDLTQVVWGSLPLQNGGAGTFFYNNFVSGSGDFVVTSTSLGTVDCGTVAQAVGYFAAARCKVFPAIISIGPLSTLPGRVVAAGSTLTITGTGLGSLCNGCKVTATPAGGTAVSLMVSNWTPQSITAQLPASMTGLVTISVLGQPGNDSITIMVAAGASIAVSPTSLTFMAAVGGASPAAQTIAITNGGGGTLAWTATTSGGSWLSVSATSGTAPSELSVAVSSAGLVAGTYTGEVQITSTGASNSPVSVAVTLTVSANTATLVVSPSTLSFQYTVGGAGALQNLAQNISIVNAGGGTISWTASASDFWLSATPSAGPAPAQVAIAVNPANLAAGTYTGSVSISSPGAAGSPAMVTVTLVVAGSQAPGTITGVTNAAGFAPGFASATWVAIFGTNLSQSTYTWQPADVVNGQLPTSLHGVSVSINGVAAYVEYISPTQINVLAPDDAAAGSVPIVVTTAGTPGNSINGQKQALAPAFFTNGAYAAAQHADYSVVDATHPAQPGEVLLIYGTGFGATNPAVPTSQLVTAPAPLAGSVRFSFGKAIADVSYAGLVEAGLYQFNVMVPAGLPNGNATVTASIGGVQTQSGVTIPVQQ
jgi:uncharacterized protein (TIGR03437 family)